MLAPAPNCVTNRGTEAVNRQEIREWVQTIGVVAIPVVVGLMGYRVAKSNADREVNAKMVEIAAQVLTVPGNYETRTVRRWAGEVMKRYSDVPFPAESAIIFYLPPRSGPPAPETVQIVITPRNVHVLPSEQVEFRVFGRTAAGDSVDIGVSWTATGGGIMPAAGGGGQYAHYTAGTAAGDFVVAARSSLGLVDTARVHIRVRQR